MCLLAFAIFFATTLVVAVAETVVAAYNQQFFAVYDAIGQFESGFFVNLRNCASGDVHLLGTLCVGFLFIVNKPQHFIFVKGKLNASTLAVFAWLKAVKFRFAAYSPASLRSGHFSTFFPVYVEYTL